jgi:trk system potassium uptake protein TrkA
MKQFAVIGLGSFGRRMVEELSDVTTEIIILDKDSDAIESFKDRVKNAYITDVLNEEAIRRIIPQGIDAVVVDLGGSIEASILVTNYLKKLGVGEIIVKAATDAHGEVLRLVGASTVIYPDLEAARRLTPMMVSSLLFNYMPISAGLVLAEVLLPERFSGMTLIEANLRQKYSINVIAFRNEGGGDYQFFNPGHKLQADEILLVAGKEKDVIEFSGRESTERRTKFAEIFKNVFAQKRPTGKDGKKE